MEYSLGLYEKAMPAAPFETLLRLTAEAGFDRLELSIDESEARQSRLDWTEKEQRALGNLAREAGAPILTLCLSAHRRFPLGSHRPELRERSLELMKKAILFSSNAGVRLVQLAGYDVYYEQGDEDTQAWFYENLQKSVDFAAQWGVTLAFETMETPFMDTVEKAMAVVERIQSPWLGVYPDIGNLTNAAALYGGSAVVDLCKGRGRLAALHLKETAPGVYRDLPFGEAGQVDYTACIRAALQMGVRLFTGEFWYKQGQPVEKTLRTSALFLRDKIEEAARGLAAQEGRV